MRHISSTLLSIFTTATLLAGTAASQAQEGYTPSPEIQQAQREFRDMGFGIFIHWGIYSMPGRGEWVLNRDDVSLPEYRHLASGFYPSRFDADAWAKAIKDSGAGYICFTSRHHDGFSMWDSKATDYDIVDATPFGRDIVGELAQACHDNDLKLHLYYSQIDWGRDDYVKMGRTGIDSTRRLDGRWEDYLAFMDAQLTELLTSYGPIGAIWYDGMWDRDETPEGPTPETWNCYGQYALIHSLQPSCMVGSNHHSDPYPGEDFQIFERDKPGENFAGYSAQAITHLPLETCQTMNRTWGYNIYDGEYKSADDLIKYLVTTAGRDANLLLNIGPRPDGTLPDQALERLAAMGRWMDTYGPTVKGVRGGPVAPHEWGVTTRRGDTIYVHILDDCADDTIFLPLPGMKMKSAVEFASGRKVDARRVDGGVLLDVSRRGEFIPDYVIALTVK